MDLTTILFVIAVIACIYMACNIGANDVANAMGTSVGSKTLTYRQAIMVAAVAEFSGALLVGGHVSDTIRNEMIDPEIFSGAPIHLVYGMIAALISASVWLHLASYLGWPVSTTHAIIGGVVGFGMIAGGVEAINWGKMGGVVMSWFISPFFGGLCSFAMFRYIHSRIFQKRKPIQHAKKIVPYLTFLVCVILVNSIIYKGLKNLHLDLVFWKAIVIATIVGMIVSWCTHILVQKVNEDDDTSIAGQYRVTEDIFKYLQFATAFYVAFAHGSNDVANAVGPLAAVSEVLHKGEIGSTVPMPFWILALGGICIVIGLLIWGARVMVTIGKEITEITPSRGFSAEFGAATVVLICSKFGLPISTTHTLVGSVIGVGLARGIAQLNLTIIKRIVVSWFTTIPFTMILSIIFFKVFLLFLS